MLKEKVKALLEEAFEEYKSLFLVDLIFKGNNEITVVIDGDEGVTVQDCINVSRKVEHNLDREEEDFSLEVMSSGATEPLINKRQYKKNIGRDLEVKLQDGSKVTGLLTEVDDQGVTLSWKERVAKEVGKGKVTVDKEEVFSFDSIEQAKVKIKF
ncbi:ribosome assembly cofactor RimP [Leeuwenhoekiella aequorea]|jgi:ribosome maturation factor RimP|uniref:Ribosome maturation factor RimP n=1 Tax=Leeuwenhoekiella aequorea TaxID=283736 RepID=A0A4Q0PDM2_9FLAO|nr:ribosome assembly cofactor RimP [Leeuwenhoekiella aequorea]RXG24648.1 ribosome maturation factor RimP [Leeuwenhoekiella aequorea]|tara:strand:+ start:179 stop:643 length:465 start_codon:yes stop_codon:yes gene_type:complete